MGSDRTRRAPLGGVRALFAEVFTSSPRVPSERYALYNAVLGGLLLLIATMLFLESERGSTSSAVGLGGLGLILQLGIVRSALGGGMSPRVLLLSGLLLLIFVVALAVSSIVRAVRAPPLSAFRYMPGLLLLLAVYGTLQVAASRPGSPRAKRIKMLGLCLGLACELGLMAALAMRALR